MIPQESRETHRRSDLLVSLSLLQPEPRPQKIDQLVIDGHVLPDQVLFTAPTSDNVPYRTLVFSDNLKVTVSFLHAHSKGDDSSILRRPIATSMIPIQCSGEGGGGGGWGRRKKEGGADRDSDDDVIVEIAD